MEWCRWGCGRCPGVCVEGGILVVPINGTVIVVCSRLADDVDLSAFGAAKRGIVIGDTDPELGNIFDADGNDGRLVSAARDNVIGDINAIEVESVLIAARAGDGAAAVAETAAVGALEGC